MWVTAVGLAGLAVFHGSSPTPPVLLDPVETDSILQASNARILVHIDQPVLPDDTLLGAGSRPIFPRPDTVAAAVPEPVVESVRVLPILKGIVSSDLVLRAVFASSDDPYVVVGPGEAIAGYIVTDISSDRVTARDDAGATQIFMLRGSGES